MYIVQFELSRRASLSIQKKENIPIPEITVNSAKFNSIKVQYVICVWPMLIIDCDCGCDADSAVSSLRCSCRFQCHRAKDEAVAVRLAS